MSKQLPTELISNKDGSVYHLGIVAEEISDDIILVGDPGRVNLIAGFLDEVDYRKSNREFNTATGWYRGKRVSIISTGIGTDNMEIVVTELDALFNPSHPASGSDTVARKLNFIRIGTSGTIQPDIRPGSFILSEKSVGLDGLLHFYQGSENYRDSEWEEAFFSAVPWPGSLPRPYIVGSSENLRDRFSGNEFIHGLTLSAPGFYGPQVRTVRLGLKYPDQIGMYSRFLYREKRILNFEMESSVLYGLSRMLGHQALTLCMVLANRVSGELYPEHGPAMKQLAGMVLDRLPFSQEA